MSCFSVTVRAAATECDRKALCCEQRVESSNQMLCLISAVISIWPSMVVLQGREKSNGTTTFVVSHCTVTFNTVAHNTLKIILLANPCKDALCISMVLSIGLHSGHKPGFLLDL